MNTCKTLMSWALVLWACLNLWLLPAALAATELPTVALPASALPTSELAEAIFAGGCFWCLEAPFDQLPGVVATVSGYTGGTRPDPTYSEVSSGITGHLEAVQVRYDPAQASYEQLLAIFWKNIDPVDTGGQFCDRGSQYQAAIFYLNSQQQQVAIASKQAIATQLGLPIATEILPAAPFYEAETYHQNYYQTHPLRYRVYRFGCGRDQRLQQVWGDMQV